MGTTSTTIMSIMSLIGDAPAGAESLWEQLAEQLAWFNDQWPMESWEAVGVQVTQMHSPPNVWIKSGGEWHARHSLWLRRGKPDFSENWGVLDGVGGIFEGMAESSERTMPWFRLSDRVAMPAITRVSDRPQFVSGYDVSRWLREASVWAQESPYIADGMVSIRVELDERQKAVDVLTRKGLGFAEGRLGGPGVKACLSFVLPPVPSQDGVPFPDVAAGTMPVECRLVRFAHYETSAMARPFPWHGTHAWLVAEADLEDFLSDYEWMQPLVIDPPAGEYYAVHFYEVNKYVRAGQSAQELPQVAQLSADHAVEPYWVHECPMGCPDCGHEEEIRRWSTPWQVLIRENV